MTEPLLPELSQHWLVARLKPHQIELASNTPAPIDRSDRELNNNLSTSRLAFSMAAAELLGIHGQPHYNGNPAGRQAAAITARLTVANGSIHHPLARAANTLETASLFIASGNAEELRRWVNDHKVYERFPAGHTTVPWLHHYYRITRSTIAAITGITPKRHPPDDAQTLAHRIHSAIERYTQPDAPPIDVAVFYHYLGLRVWAEALVKHYRFVPADEVADAFTAATKVINDVYLTPPMYWVRAAFAVIHAQRETP